MRTTTTEYRDRRGNTRPSHRLMHTIGLAAAMVLCAIGLVAFVIGGLELAGHTPPVQGLPDPRMLPGTPTPTTTATAQGPARIQWVTWPAPDGAVDGYGCIVEPAPADSDSGYTTPACWLIAAPPHAPSVGYHLSHDWQLIVTDPRMAAVFAFATRQPDTGCNL